jgi:hypothetical protein
VTMKVRSSCYFYIIYIEICAHRKDGAKRNYTEQKMQSINQ